MGDLQVPLVSQVPPITFTQERLLVCDGRHSRDYDVFRYKFTYKFPRHSRDYDIFFRLIVPVKLE